MKRSPLQLQNCYFTQVNVACRPQGEEDDVDKIDLDILVDLHPQKDNPRSWFVYLSVKVKALDGAKCPFTAEIENMGSFAVVESWPEEQIEKLVYINGSGILYASVREMVCSITSRTFWRTLTLPGCSFSEMWKEVQSKKTPELPFKSAEATKA
jgi:preprotein translocase subunit SecB